MIISVKEGTKLAEDLISSVCASVHKNNYAELMSHFFADTVEWKSVRSALIIVCNWFFDDKLYIHLFLLISYLSLMERRALAALMLCWN